MSAIKADQRLKCGAGAASVQAVASCLGAARTPRASQDDFVTSVVPSSDPRSRRADTFNRFFLAGILASIVPDLVGSFAGSGSSGPVAPMTRLAIGWSIAVPDT